FLRQGQADIAFFTEEDGIAVGEDKRSRIRSAVRTAYGFHADAFDDGFRILCAAFRTFSSYVAVAICAVFDHLIVAGGSGLGSHSNGLDPYGNGITRFRTFYINRLCHFMAAFNAWRDHRSPTAWRRIGDNGPAVFYWPEHFFFGIQNAIYKMIHE